MTSLTILVAPPGPVPLGLRDHLADWVAAGLVKPFLWVLAERVTVDGTSALLVNPDGMVPVQLQSYLGRAPAEELVLGVLVPVAAGAPTVAASVEGAVWQQLAAARNTARVVPLRCLLARRLDPVQAEVGTAGWHNVVVSPEDSADPTVAVAPLPPTDDPAEIGRQGAVAVAGLAGMWVGCGQSPLATLTPVNGRYARLARSHLLWADATALGAAIETKTLDTQVVPRPAASLGATGYIDDATTAAQMAADSLLQAHRGELLSPREPAPAPEVTQLGIGAALRMFWGFLAKALANAPGTWARSLLARAGSQVAQVVHQQVFGDGSSYQVVAGMRSASPLEISQTAQNLGAHLDRVAGSTLEPTATFPGLWQDFVAGGLTLIDGGSRTEAVPPVRVGTEVAVVRTPDAVAPSPATRVKVDPRVPGVTGSRSVSPADWVAMNAVVTLAEQARSADPRNSYLGDVVTGIKDFRLRYGSSYAAKVGERLGGLLLSLIDEVNTLSTRLGQAATADDGTAELQAEQARLGRRMQLLAIYFVLSLVLVTGLGVSSVMTTGWVIGTGVGCLLAWVLGSLATFIQGQRNLFAALNRREVAAGQAEANFRNLRVAVRDLRRTSDAYNQLQAWARVLGAFVHRPLGEQPGSERPALAGLSGTPRNISVGEVHQSPAGQDQIAAHLRRRLFQVSWMSPAWQALLNDAPRRLGPRAADLVGAPERLFAERTDVAESLLDRWAEVLEQEGVGPVGGTAARAMVRDQLSGAGGEDYLVGSEVTSADGRQLPLETFLGGLVDPQRLGQRFDGRILGVEARTDQGLSGVERALVTPLPVLGRAVARVELSPDIPAELFVIDRGYQTSYEQPSSPTPPTPPKIDLVM
ncbi:MAG: hypothetical protein Q4G45_00280 [Actinomycetia bacterium]|nr:hypothetical protein [Actinomycetes bacterium]